MHRVGRIDHVPAILRGVIRNTEVVHTVHDAVVIVITVDVDAVCGAPVIEVVQEVRKDLLVVPVAVDLHISAPAGDEAGAAATCDLSG